MWLVHWYGVIELLVKCCWVIDEVLLSYWWSVTEFLVKCYKVIDEVLQSYWWSVTKSLMKCYRVIGEVLQSHWWGVTDVFSLSATVPVDRTLTLNTPHSPTQATRSVSALMCCLPVCLIAYRHDRHLWNSAKSIFDLPFPQQWQQEQKRGEHQK